MSKWIYEGIYVLVVIFCLMVVASAERHNGRIEMCDELGMKYLVNDECISKQEYDNLNSMPELNFNPSRLGDT